MKKVMILAVTLLMVLSLAGCSSNTSSVKQIEGTLEEIMVSVYENADSDFSRFMNTEINDENIAYFLGTSDIEYVEALASEPMISAIAHSVVLVRVAQGVDVEDAKAKIKENVDGRKWICVGVEDENILVENVGDLIILSMDNESSKLIVDSFMALAK